MSWRIMPYRSVDEHEVINGLFSSTDANATHLTAGAGDAGVFVRITVGDLNTDPLVYVDGAGRSDLIGKVDYPDVGRNWIPVVTNKFDTATRAEKCIGVTLAQTALADENGVTFYNDPRKAEANGIVPSGGAVPIMARGLVTLCETAFENGDVLIGSVGQNLIVSATAGKVTGVAYTSTGHVHQVVGTVLATGSRTAGSTQDRFAGAAGTVGKYALCYIDCIGY